MFARPIEIKAVILVGKKAGLAVGAALDEVEVKWDIRQREAGGAGVGVTPMLIKKPWAAPDFPRSRFPHNAKPWSVPEDSPHFFLADPCLAS
jgi:hypothetical protein